VRRQSEAATGLLIVKQSLIPVQSKAVSRFACHRIPKSAHIGCFAAIGFSSDDDFGILISR